MRVFSLARLTSRERYVIGLLRGADPGSASGGLLALFDRLRTTAGELGFRPGPLTGAYASRQELCLLGCIAAMQRENPGVLLKISGAIRTPTLACARRLAFEGVHLNHASISRLSSMIDACKELSVSTAPLLQVRPRSQRRPLPPMPGSLQEKALTFVCSRGIASSRDLAALGVSRQVVSLMFKQGLLVRVRTGVYRAASELKRG
jgi:hypothetical protein